MAALLLPHPLSFPPGFPCSMPAIASATWPRLLMTPLPTLPKSDCGVRACAHAPGRRRAYVDEMQHIRSMKDGEMVSVLFDSIKTMAGGNTVITTELDVIMRVFFAKGVLCMKTYRNLKRSDVALWFENAEPPIAEAWLETLEQFTEILFKEAESQAAGDDGPALALKEARPRGLLRLLSPNKVLVMLGTELAEAGRLSEIDETFQPHQFYEILIDNPGALLHGHPICSKSVERTTDVVLEIVILKWHNLNFDKVFCNKVATLIRSAGIKMPKRGKVRTQPRSAHATRRRCTRLAVAGGAVYLVRRLPARPPVRSLPRFETYFKPRSIAPPRPRRLRRRLATCATWRSCSATRPRRCATRHTCTTAGSSSRRGSSTSPRARSD